MKRSQFILSTGIFLLASCNSAYDLGLINRSEVLPPTIEEEGVGGTDVAAPLCYAKKYQQPEEDRIKDVDLLFVTDTSGSLNDERTKIASQIDAYVAKLPSDVNLRIGVMLGHGPKSQWMGKLYTYKSNNIVLDTSKLSMSEIRSQLTSRLKTTATDSWTDGGETNFVSLYHGIRGDRLESMKAQGFFRDGAALAVVFISDENEICHIYPSGTKRVKDYESYAGMTVEQWAFKQYCSVSTHDDPTKAVNLSYKVMYSELKHLKGDQPLLIASMVYTDPSNYPKVSENEYGYGYVEIAQESGGALVNLADSDYSKGLAFIGEMTAVRLNLVTDFTLDHDNIDPATLKVSVDSEPAIYTYSEATKTVVLNEAGSAKSEIAIRYCLKGEDYEGGGGGDGGTTDPETPSDPGPGDDDSPPVCGLDSPDCGGLGI